jgi:hypothetical protein
LWKEGQCPSQKHFRLKLTLTNSMEHSPSWEANRSSASQEISNILWNPKVHYRIHKRPPSLPSLSQNNAVHAFPSYGLKSVLRLSFHLSLGLPSCLFRSDLLTKDRVCNSPVSHACYLPRPSHSSWFLKTSDLDWSFDTTQDVEVNPTKKSFCTGSFWRNRPFLTHITATAGAYVARNCNLKYLRHKCIHATTAIPNNILRFFIDSAKSFLILK